MQEKHQTATGIMYKWANSIKNLSQMVVYGGEIYGLWGGYMRFGCQKLEMELEIIANAIFRPLY